MTGSTATPSKWETDLSNVFRKGYKHKDKPDKERVKSIMASMVQSEDPRDFGTLKDTKYGRLFVLDFGKYRLSYRVNITHKTIEMVRVCDHKAVYGKD